MAVNSGGTRFMFGDKAVGRLVSIGEVTPDSEEIDVTTLDSPNGYREYLQGYKDPGILSVEGYHDGDDAGQQALRTAFDSGRETACSIIFPDGSMVTFSAYVKSYTIGAAKVDGAVGFSARLRLSGAVEYTAG